MTATNKKEPIGVPFGRSYWVVPGQFLAGALPSDSDQQGRSEKIRSLLDFGVRAFVNLMENQELDHSGRLFTPYDETVREISKEMGVECFLYNFQVPDKHCPTHEQMLKILDRIDSLLSESKPVYVHCWGGIGRTGTVVGCWLVRHGIARGRAVIEHIARLRRNEASAQRPSPETELQRLMVMSWEEL